MEAVKFLCGGDRMSLIGIGTAIATATPWLGEWVMVGIAGKLVESAIRRFKPDELELLLKDRRSRSGTAEDRRIIRSLEII